MNCFNEKEFEKWTNGEIYEHFGKLVTKKEVEEIYKKYIAKTKPSSKQMSFEDFARCENYLKYEEYLNDDYLEVEETEYVTSSGEKIHIFCKYGYDY